MTFLEKTKRFFEPLLQSPKYLILSLLKFIIWAYYSIVSVFLIRESIDAISQGSIDRFVKYLQGFTIFVIAYFLINYFGRKWEWPKLYYVTEKYISDMYVRKILMLDMNYIEGIGSGKLISIVQNGIKRWNEQLAFLIRDFTRTTVVFVVTIYSLSSMNFTLGIVFLGIIILLHILVAWVDGFARKYRKIRTDTRNEYSRKLSRIIMSKSEIVQNNQSDQFSKELYGIHEQIENADTKVAQTLFIIFNIPRVFLSLSRIAILYFIGFGVFRGEFSIADFTLAITILLMFETFLLDSIESYKNFTKEFTTIENFWETIDKGPIMKCYDDGAIFQIFKKPIEIVNVSYAYNKTSVFHNFSLTIPHGKKTALVGASGGGKTTLMKLIAGYLHPDEGYVSVLGNRLDETALKTYYPHIGYLTQDPSVFDGTIRENLISALPDTSVMSTESSVPVTMRHPAGKIRTREQDFSISLVPRSSRNDRTTGSTIDSISDRTSDRTTDSISDRTSEGETLEHKLTETLEHKLTEALRLAHADFVFSLEHGIDTEIGERGVRLSGGQKQRLAIAKIFLKNPEIILLDEPTSALDSFSEEQITKALDTLFKNRTVIIIAHRLQTVKKADDIIVIEQGQTQERGTHDELIAKRGIYHTMLELQSGF